MLFLLFILSTCYFPILFNHLKTFYCLLSLVYLLFRHKPNIKSHIASCLFQYNVSLHQSSKINKQSIINKYQIKYSKKHKNKIYFVKKTNTKKKKKKQKKQKKKTKNKTTPSPFLPTFKMCYQKKSSTKKSLCSNMTTTSSISNVVSVVKILFIAIYCYSLLSYPLLIVLVYLLYVFFVLLLP